MLVVGILLGTETWSVKPQLKHLSEYVDMYVQIDNYNMYIYILYIYGHPPPQCVYIYMYICLCSCDVWFNSLTFNCLTATWLTIMLLRLSSRSVGGHFSWQVNPLSRQYPSDKWAGKTWATITTELGLYNHPPLAAACNRRISMGFWSIGGLVSIFKITMGFSYIFPQQNMPRHPSKVGSWRKTHQKLAVGYLFLVAIFFTPYQ